MKKLFLKQKEWNKKRSINKPIKEKIRKARILKRERREEWLLNNPQKMDEALSKIENQIEKAEDEIKPIEEAVKEEMDEEMSKQTKEIIKNVDKFTKENPDFPDGVKKMAKQINEEIVNEIVEKASIKKTKKAYEEYLNKMDIPEHKKERVGDRVKNYGSWLRKNDPTAFEVGFNEW